jgi:hypothetical protein
MIRHLLYFLFLLSLLFSCRKDDEIKTQKSDSEEKVTIDMNTAIQLKTGNYWIYRRILTNPDGTKNFTSIYDSIYIEKDSLDVTGRKYFIRKGYAPVFEALYDSAGCVVRAADGKFWLKPEVIFSETNFKDTIYRNDVYYGKMYLETAPVEVPAGVYKTLVFSIMPLGESHQSEDGTSHHYQQDFYAKGVGLIKRAYNHFGTPVEHSLIRYKLK